MDAKVEQALLSLHWLGHDAFRLDSPQGAIYIDPHQLNAGQPKAIMALISHDHFDHYSPEDLAKIITPDTIVCAPASVAKMMRHPKIEIMKPGDTITPLENITVTATPAYNINKDFHPKANNWPGFVLTVDNVSFYHAGDSDFIPEMADIKAHVALLPVSGTYTMTAEEAAQAALTIKPQVAIPMHYGSIVGTDADAQRFAKLLEGAMTVKILDKE